MAAWIISSIISALVARRLVVAFLLGLLCSAGFVGYCMYYQGGIEGAGIPQAFGGATLVVGMFYLARWFRRIFRGSKDDTKTDI